MSLRRTRARDVPVTAEQLAPLAGEVDTAMRRLPGLPSHHLGVDRRAGMTVAVSVWDPEEPCPLCA